MENIRGLVKIVDKSLMEVQSGSALVSVEKALVRPPPQTVASGITENGSSAKARYDIAETKKRHAKILDQWKAYVEALEEHGVKVFEEKPDEKNPDSHYIQDHAFVINTYLSSGPLIHYAITARPGSKARSRETNDVKNALRKQRAGLMELSRGRIEMGDVVPDFEHKVIFIGITVGKKPRTDTVGVDNFARAIKAILPDFTVVGLKHSGSPHLGTHFTVLGNDIAVYDSKGMIKFDEPYIPRISDNSQQLPFNGLKQLVPYDEAKPGTKGIIELPPEEGYAANMLIVNNGAIVASGHPTAISIAKENFDKVTELEMSESRSMDGSLTCWSLLFNTLRT